MRYKNVLLSALLAATGLFAAAEVNQDWLRHVPPAERARANPLAGQPEAVAAGAHLYADHCSRCHGPDLQGAHGKPSLQTDAVRNASDGELFWLLRNGDLRHGMPSWSSLPEPERWQILAYLRTATGRKPASP